MNCAVCGEAFEPLTVTQKYCSKACGRRAYVERKRAERHGKARTYPEDGMVLSCGFCGKSFTLMHYTNKAGRVVRDRRSRFCCATCEKKYWRHPPQDDPRCYTVGTLAQIVRHERRSKV